VSKEIKDFRDDRVQVLVYELFLWGGARMTGSRLVARGRHPADQCSTVWASVNEMDAISH